jgi:hypothetical protein
MNMSHIFPGRGSVHWRIHSTYPFRGLMYRYRVCFTPLLVGNVRGFSMDTALVKDAVV